MNTSLEFKSLQFKSVDLNQHNNGSQSIKISIECTQYHLSNWSAKIILRKKIWDSHIAIFPTFFALTPWKCAHKPYKNEINQPYCILVINQFDRKFSPEPVLTWIILTWVLFLAVLISVSVLAFFLNQSLVIKFKSKLDNLRLRVFFDFYLINLIFINDRDIWKKIIYDACLLVLASRLNNIVMRHQCQFPLQTNAYDKQMKPKIYEQ